MIEKYYYLKVVKCGCDKQNTYIFVNEEVVLSVYRVLSKELEDGSYEIYFYDVFEGYETLREGIRINGKERKYFYDNN